MNLPEPVRDTLSELGHDAQTVAKVGLGGAQDETELAAQDLAPLQPRCRLSLHQYRSTFHSLTLK